MTHHEAREDGGGHSRQVDDEDDVVAGEAVRPRGLHAVLGTLQQTLVHVPTLTLNQQHLPATVSVPKEQAGKTHTTHTLTAH